MRRSARPNSDDGIPERRTGGERHLAYDEVLDEAARILLMIKAKLPETDD